MSAKNFELVKIFLPSKIELRLTKAPYSFFFLYGSYCFKKFKSHNIIEIFVRDFSDKLKENKSKCIGIFSSRLSNQDENKFLKNEFNIKITLEKREFKFEMELPNSENNFEPKYMVLFYEEANNSGEYLHLANKLNLVTENSNNQLKKYLVRYKIIRIFIFVIWAVPLALK